MEHYNFNYQKQALLGGHLWIITLQYHDDALKSFPGKCATRRLVQLQQLLKKLSGYLMLLGYDFHTSTYYSPTVTCVLRLLKMERVSTSGSSSRKCARVAAVSEVELDEDVDVVLRDNPITLSLTSSDGGFPMADTCPPNKYPCQRTCPVIHTCLHLFLHVFISFTSILK